MTTHERVVTSRLLLTRPRSNELGDLHGLHSDPRVWEHFPRTARRVAPHLPVVAYLVEHNHASRRAAERAGLELVWRGPDAGNPDPTAVRIILADRELDQAAIAAFRS